MKKSILTVSLSIITLCLQAQQIPNGGFEIWKTTTFGVPPISFSYEEPEGWQTFNILAGTHPEKPVSKSTDRMVGNFSLLAKNIVPAGASEAAPGLAYTKFKISLFPQTLNGYYKSLVNSPGDSLGIFAYATRWNPDTKTSDFVAVAALTITATQSTFKSFSIPFIGFASFLPDSISITITSSDNNKTVGTSLWVDDLALSYGPSALTFTDNSIESAKIFPSPASEIFYISNLKENVTSYKLINTQGLEVKSGSIINPDLTEVNIENQKAGLYFIETFDISHSRVSRHKISIK